MTDRGIGVLYQGLRCRCGNDLRKNRKQGRTLWQVSSPSMP